FCCFLLFLSKGLKRRPWHISRDVPLSVRRFEVCRLHQRINVGNLKHTLLLSHSYVVASFRCDHIGLGTHPSPPGYWQIAGPLAGRYPIAAILTPPCLE